MKHRASLLQIDGDRIYIRRVRRRVLRAAKSDCRRLCIQIARIARCVPSCNFSPKYFRASRRPKSRVSIVSQHQSAHSGNCPDDNGSAIFTASSICGGQLSVRNFVQLRAFISFVCIFLLGSMKHGNVLKNSPLCSFSNQLVYFLHSPCKVCIYNKRSLHSIIILYECAATFLH